MKEKATVNRTSRTSNSVEREARPKVKVLSSAMNKDRFFQDISFSDLKDEYKLKTGSVFSEKVNLLLANPPRITRSARGPSNSAHEMFSKKIMKESVRVSGSLVATGAHGHIFCSNVVFYY